MARVAVLFAELRMEKLYDLLGEQAVDPLVKVATAQLREDVKTSGGRTVKTIGDEILAVFPEVVDAVAAAIAMQRSLHALASAWPGGSRLGVGFSWGPVVDRDGDVFGDTVSIAARAASLADACKIVLSGDAAACLRPDQREACPLVHAIGIKGGAVKIEFFNLPWS